MDNLNQWWGGLQSLNQWFFMAAAFFSVFLFWQFVAAIFGLGGGHAEFDTHAEANWSHHTPSDAHDTVVTFKLLSIRSILAFLTLFTWAGALYMSSGVPVARALGYALLWGVGAMFVVSLIFHGLRRMTESGTQGIATCVGTAGTVYLNIPAGGAGEVRVMCSGVLTHFKARAVGGAAVKAGTSIRVIGTLASDTVEVEVDETDETQEKKG